MPDCKHDKGWLMIFVQTAQGEVPLEICLMCRAVFAPKTTKEKEREMERERNENSRINQDNG